MKLQYFVKVLFGSLFFVQDERTKVEMLNQGWEMLHQRCGQANSHKRPKLCA